MSLIAAENLKSLKATVDRSFRYLTRVRDEVKAILAESTLGPIPDDSNEELGEKTEVLQEQRSEFHKELAQFEQIAAKLDDQTHAGEIEKWSDVDYECKLVLVKARKVLKKSATVNQVSAGESQPAAPTSASVVSDPTLNDNFTRLLTLLESQQRSADSPASHNPSTQSSSSANAVQAKLPRLELPKFSGDLLKWKPFWDRFEASVDGNDKLAPVDKLGYLVGLLEKIPLKLIESLPVTNDNYAVAVNMLKTKYGDQRMVITLLYRKMTEMQPVKNDVCALRKFAAEIDCLLGSLGAMGQDTTDDSFATIILSKLPTPVVVQLELAKSVEVDWTVAVVREKLSEYLTKIERATKISAARSGFGQEPHEFTGDSLFGGEKGKRQRKGQGGKRGGKSEPKLSNVPVRRQGERDEKDSVRSKSCIYCQGSHWSDQCEKYADADARYQQLGGNRCANCLKEGHQRRDCRSPKPCFYCKKVGSHHSSLCFIQFGRQKPESSQLGGEQTKKGQGDDESDSEHSASIQLDKNENGLLASGEEVRLQTAKIPISAANRKVKYITTRALLDPGCNRSYCSEKLARALGLKTSPGPTLEINRFGSKKPLQVFTRIATVQVKALDGTAHVIEVSVIPQISGCLTLVPVKSDQLSKLKSRVTLADDIPVKHESGPIDLLIGSDYYLDFITGEKILVTKGLYLLGSEFGYILAGRLQKKARDHPHVSMCGFTGGVLSELADLEPVPKADTQVMKSPEISDYWSLEAIGITDDPESNDDQKAIDDFERNICMENGRYQVSLPWNDRVPDLQSNFALCKGRLKSLIRRIGYDDYLWSTYTKTIEDQVKKGVVEPVSDSSEGQAIHYIPHHAVVEPERETTKVRVVYDGSAKAKRAHVSLNECLYRGPIILEDLVGVLLRFRLSPVAVIADIEKAFLQIEIRDCDRDRLRFLWLKNPKVTEVEGNLQVYRFTRVPFGLNCSPSLLAQVIRHHLHDSGTAIAQKLLDNLYVDNVFGGMNTVKEAADFYEGGKTLFKTISMNLRSWASNCKQFEQSIPAEDRLQKPVVKVLGLKWDTTEDRLNVSSPTLERLASAGTKREILSGISAVFDPLGWFSPCTLPSKCVLQSMSQDRQEWDAPVEAKKLSDWKKESESLARIRDIQIPRLMSARGNLSLVAFCDASRSSYATAVYLISDDGNA